MNPLTSAILKTGIIDENMLREVRRFGAPIEPSEAETPVPPRTAEEAAMLLEEALQSEGLVLTKETDLEVLRAYTQTNRRGLLHLEVDAGFELGESVESTSNIDVSFGQTKTGDYIIPWFADSIAEMMTNGRTYLIDDALKGDQKVYFSVVRELYFGNVKSFMVCVPARSSNG